MASIGGAAEAQGRSETRGRREAGARKHGQGRSAPDERAFRGAVLSRRKSRNNPQPGRATRRSRAARPAMPNPWRKIAVGIAAAGGAFLALLFVKAHFAFSPDLEAEVEEAEIGRADEVVVLVHGLGRSPLSMAPMARALEDEGYETLNWGYSSTCCSAQELGEGLARELEAIERAEPAALHFVGHSLGSILIQIALEERPDLPPGEVVMLAPPNRGAKSADRYADLVGWFLVPLDDLTTDRQSTARRLSPRLEDRRVGVIAGARDGKVSVGESIHEAQDDHAVVSAAHTFIMARAEVQRLVRRFLDRGRFSS